jgi:hypothetical protein
MEDDTVSNFPEISRIHNKTAEHVGLQLKNEWLSRFDTPVYAIYDQGPEFLGVGFQNGLRTPNIRGHRTTVKNPQANAIANDCIKQLPMCYELFHIYTYHRLWTKSPY